MALPKSPKNMDNIGQLVSALQRLERLEQKYNREYVFEDIQEPHLGGTCRPAPVGLIRNENSSTKVLATYNKQFLKDRIQYLKDIA